MNRLQSSPWLILTAITAIVAACTGGGSSSASLVPRGGIPVIPPATVKPPDAPGLCAIVAGERILRIEWRLPGSGLEAALFQGDSRSVVFDAAPIAAQLSGDHLLLGGLENGRDLYLGLGIRAVGAAEYRQAGVVLHSRPGVPIYVDAGANPSHADGLSPATAFADLQAGIDAAHARGGGNLWLRSGSYLQAVQVPPGVDLYGGFPPGFELSQRDHLVHEVRLSAGAGESVVTLLGGAPGSILDGLMIDGSAGASIGIDADDSPLELRSTNIEGMASRGLKMRNSSTLGCVDVQIANCSFSANGGDGLSLNGAYDLRVDGSRFNSNVQEGMDLDDLVALDAGTATLRVTGSQFFGNGAEGLDVDLVAPSVLGPNGGRFVVSIRGCSFERNSADGLLVDMDYELTPGWVGKIVIRECVARANGAAGIHVDADAPASVLIHRVLASANRGDGITVSSESDPGYVQVTNSLVTGNLGAGMRAFFGNKAIAASHCVFAGNSLGGLVSERIDSTASSSIAYLQPFPWVGTRTTANTEIKDPSSPNFVNAAIAFARILAQDNGTLALDGAAIIASEFLVEILDDGIGRRVEEVLGASLTVSPVPGTLSLPAAVALFPSTAAVLEDYHLVLGSPASGQGLTAPTASPVDAGIFPRASGPAAGLDNEPRRSLFRITDTQPQVSLGIFSAQPLLLTFSAAIDPSSVDRDAFQVVSMSGFSLDIDPIAFAEDQILIGPPATGWGSEPFTLQILHGLLALDGTELVSSLTLPFLPL